MKQLSFSIIKLVLVFVVVAFFLLGTASAQEVFLANQAENKIYLPLAFKNFSNIPGFGDVTGYVYDSRTGDPVEGIVVCLEGTSTCASETASDGQYLLEDIPNGTQKLATQDPQDRYQVLEEFVLIITDLTVAHDFHLYPVLGENQFRVVLTWDSNVSWPCAPFVCPNDFNLHMWWTSNEITYERYDIDNRGNCADLEVYPNVCYESDVQHGTGPESIAFKIRNVGNPGIYHFAVLNYYADWPNVPSFFNRTPPARLQLFASDQSLPVYDFEFNNPATIGDGDLWYVFQLEYGTFIQQNCLSLFDQVGDYPPEDCYPDVKKYK